MHWPCCISKYTNKLADSLTGVYLGIDLTCLPVCTDGPVESLEHREHNAFNVIEHLALCSLLLKDSIISEDIVEAFRSQELQAGSI